MLSKVFSTFTQANNTGNRSLLHSTIKSTNQKFSRMVLGSETPLQPAASTILPSSQLFAAPVSTPSIKTQVDIMNKTDELDFDLTYQRYHRHLETTSATSPPPLSAAYFADCMNEFNKNDNQTSDFVAVNINNEGKIVSSNKQDFDISNINEDEILSNEWINNKYDSINNEMLLIQNELMNHRMYSLLTDIKSLHVLMSSHVFQVWDFMFLASKMQKLLQNHNNDNNNIGNNNNNSSSSIPWLPPKNNTLTRFATEIMLCEETDSFSKLTELTGKESMSHFEIYLAAMKQIGLDITFINNLIDDMSNGSGSDVISIINKMKNDIKNNSWDNNNNEILVTEACLDTFLWHINLVNNCDDINNLHLICAAFMFGRENIIPLMFEQVIKFIPKNDDDNSNNTQLFWLYLERHIEVDGHGDNETGSDSHQLLGQKLIKLLCNYDENKWNQCLNIGKQSLMMRCNVWNQVAQKIELMNFKLNSNSKSKSN